MAKKPSPAQVAARKRFAEMARSGVWKRKARKTAARRKANPLTRVKRGSKSMTTGKTPTDRLVKRRAKTARGPAGYYANPGHKMARKPVRYAVHQVRNGQPGQLLGEFPTKAGAVEFGQAWANVHKRPILIVGKAR